MKSIVVGVDGSEGARAALAWAIEQASARRGVRVVALSAWMSYPTDLGDATRAEFASIVAEVSPDRDGVEIVEHVVRGSAISVLLDEARHAHLLVVGSRGLGGFKGLLLGSVSHQLVTHAPCPTVVVPLPGVMPSDVDNSKKPIVVGVDGSSNSIAALSWAGQWAQDSGANVRAVYAWQYPPLNAPAQHIGKGVPETEEFDDQARTELDSFVAAAAVPSDVPVTPSLRVESPAKALLDEAREAQLLVVGARGRQGFTGLLLGSVATAVAHHTPCPLAVIPAPSA